MKKILILIFFYIFQNSLQGQTVEKFDSSFVYKIIKNKEDTVKAIFDWVASNIDYDVEMLKTGNYPTPKESLNYVWLNKKGVCAHYAELFNAFCRKAGVQSYIVSGLVKIEGKISEGGHAWNVIKIKGKWLCFDPTWAAGYINKDIFTRKFEPDWYAVLPEKFIYTHIPTETAFQLLEKPLEIQDILAKRKSNLTEKYFFEDSINTILKLDTFNLMCRELKNLEYCELMLKNSNSKTGICDNSIYIAQGNISIHFYNKILEGYKVFFPKPKWKDSEIKTLQANMNKALEQALLFQSRIKNNDENMHENSIWITDLKIKIGKMNNFLNKYLATRRIWRGFVFFIPKYWLFT